MFCTSSCKTLASYKRNKYKYNPGHYVKDNTIKKLQVNGLPLPADLESKLLTLTDKIEKLSVIKQQNIPFHVFKIIIFNVFKRKVNAYYIY